MQAPDLAILLPAKAPSLSSVVELELWLGEIRVIPADTLQALTRCTLLHLSATCFHPPRPQAVLDAVLPQVSCSTLKCCTRGELGCEPSLKAGSFLVHSSFLIRAVCAVFRMPGCKLYEVRAIFPNIREITISAKKPVHDCL